MAGKLCPAQQRHREQEDKRPAWSEFTRTAPSSPAAIPWFPTGTSVSPVLGQHEGWHWWLCAGIIPCPQVPAGAIADTWEPPARSSSLPFATQGGSGEHLAAHPMWHPSHSSHPSIPDTHPTQGTYCTSQDHFAGCLGAVLHSLCLSPGWSQRARVWVSHGSTVWGEGGSGGCLVVPSSRSLCGQE